MKVFIGNRLSFYTTVATPAKYTGAAYLNVHDEVFDSILISEGKYI